MNSIPLSDLFHTYHVQETTKYATVNKTDMVYASLSLTVHIVVIL